MGQNVHLTILSVCSIKFCDNIIGDTTVVESLGLHLDRDFVIVMPKTDHLCLAMVTKLPWSPTWNSHPLGPNTTELDRGSIKTSRAGESYMNGVDGDTGLVGSPSMRTPRMLAN